MSSIHTKKDAAESFIWSDRRFEKICFVSEKHQVIIEFTDYTLGLYRFTFFGVEQFLINDPVYCIHASHTTHDGKRKLQLSDDDGGVISFCYESVDWSEKS